MRAAELAQLLLTMPPDALVTVARPSDSYCVDCGSNGYVNTVTLDHYGPRSEVTLEYGTDPVEDDLQQVSEAEQQAELDHILSAAGYQRDDTRKATP